MIDAQQLEEAAEKLRVYDVEQGAWEQEPNGFQANATHALFHLAGDITGKDFTDSKIVETAIAPDSVQYALRLARWTGQVPRMVIPVPDQDSIARSLAARESFQAMQTPQVTFIEASATIARQLHNLDHEKARFIAETNTLSAARRAGRLLVYGAVLQSEEHSFDLFEAFDARLANLRERFDIPEPSRTDARH